jgi:predicted  nucleic acid-binding Zn-ribbon protein
MEIIFVLIGAGACIALLLIFWIASERELKNKRREIEGLLARLDGTQPDAAIAASDQPASTDAEAAELRAHNRELENQLAALSSELTHSRQTIDALQRAQRDGEGEREEMQRLNSANQKLAREATELRSRLAASEADLQNPQRDDNQPAMNRMQAEIEELRRTLETSHTKVRELEAERQNLPDLNAIQAERNLERQSFQEQIANLEKRLATEQQNLAEAQALRERIAEAENVQRSLRDEIQRYEGEIPQWQARIATAEESGRRLAALQAPCNELLAQHADLAERQRRLQDELAAFARQIAPADHIATQSSSSASLAGLETNSAAVEARPPHDPATADSRTHRFGVFGALFLMAATGIAGFQFMSSDWEQPSDQIAMASAPEQASPSPSAKASAQEPEAAINTPEIVPVKPATSEQSVKPPTQESDALAVKRERAPAPPTPPVGTYKVIQPSRVYAAPNELSRSLGDIEPGINVNVVNARDGWLEIHSKHGRPPGFIRREVAARIASTN